MNEPHIWWYVTRASSVIAWVLLTGSVVLGILLSTRVMRKIDNPAWLQDLHRYVSGLALIFVGLHMVSLMLDDFVHFSLAELLIPGAGERFCNRLDHLYLANIKRDKACAHPHLASAN